MANKYNFPFTRPPAPSPRWTNTDSLGSKIEKMFIRFIQGVIAWGSEFVAELAVDIFDASMKIMRPGLAKATDAAISSMMNMEEAPDWFKTAMQAALKETGESSFLMKAMVFYTGVFTMLTGGLNPARNMVNQRAEVEIRSYLPSPAEAAFMHQIGLMSAQGFETVMKRSGLADPLIPVYEELAKTQPTMGEVIAGYWRGVYSEAEFKAMIKRLGYTDKTQELYKELSVSIPPISDLLRMMRREAFQDPIANKYGYDEEYPAAINEFLRKLGYDESWGKYYYRADWTVPSPTMAYEMLHRGLIDINTLDDILKIADYPPFWRDKLRQLSFRPITRIDLRRLYQSGLIPEDRLVKGYTDLGYTPDDAKIMAEFAKLGNAEDEKDLTRADIIGLYIDDLIDDGLARSSLLKLGYDEAEISLLMERADFEISKKARADVIRYAQERYLAGLIDRTRVMTDLTAGGLTQTQIERYLLQWDRSIETKITLVSKADAVKFYKGGYIDETKFRSMLADLGYKPDDVNLYVIQIKDELSAEESEELSDAPNP